MTDVEARQRLLTEEEISTATFGSYGDDDIDRLVKKKRARARCRACLCIGCGVILIIGVGAVLFVTTNYTESPIPSPVPSGVSKYLHAAVASDVTLCSEVGRDILQNKKGNAVDAAVAALLCMGLADPQSMGIGGGFFMTIYNRSTGESHFLDARETAPANASKDMFVENPLLSSLGGMSIAIPGEVRGYFEAVGRFGRLNIKDVFQPAIDMARTGFKVPKSLEKALAASDPVEMKQKYGEGWNFFINPATNSSYKEGEILKLPQLAKTLETITTEGPESFYNGSLTRDILADMNAMKNYTGNSSYGSIITAEDLKKYRIMWNSTLNVTLRNKGLRVLTPPAPSGGPVLVFILNILDGYKLEPDVLKTLDGTVLTYHRIIESFKFGYAKRTNLADPTFVPNVTEVEKNLTSSDYADYIRSMITDNTTHDYMYYGPTFSNQPTKGTAHLSVVDADGNAVAVTSTVNAYFGSKVIGPRTGIIFNNEMDDFSTPGQKNIFGLYPSPANFIEAGKRPLSSMCPTIVVNKDGDVYMVVGAAGGTTITTATAYVASQVFWFGKDIKEAIDALRIHHQLLPPYMAYESGISKQVIDGLKAKNHNVTEVNFGSMSIVQGIVKSEGIIYANCDVRKGGTPDGY
ncbi:hypothetical protein CHS0354_042347 [Potamilus streckersoni]|uniref:Gamma-glutamyltranspeptidase 1 n=1 Tax=Potamilus streckersoni TaxID=2493646 RepID=A0AAE0SU61_9BIVA|nr:hypothetical protein CHS0354_042347 [Potamilus streckersoni]